MRARAGVVLVPVLVACGAMAAPVPPPRPSKTTEGVLLPFWVEDKWLGSPEFHKALAASEQVRRLRCLKGEKDPAAWLAAHLEVEVLKGPLLPRRRLFPSG